MKCGVNKCNKPAHIENVDFDEYVMGVTLHLDGELDTEVLGTLDGSIAKPTEIVDWSDSVAEPIPLCSRHYHLIKRIIDGEVR